MPLLESSPAVTDIQSSTYATSPLARERYQEAFPATSEPANAGAQPGNASRPSAAPITTAPVTMSDRRCERSSVESVTSHLLEARLTTSGRARGARCAGVVSTGSSSGSGASSGSADGSAPAARASRGGSTRGSSAEGGLSLASHAQPDRVAITPEVSRTSHPA